MGAWLPACGDGEQTGTIFLVSLGDSLAVGVMADADGKSTPPTDQGYADQLFALLKPLIPNLELVKFGCPGETTTTFVTGTKCEYPEGSQGLEAAKFLRENQNNIFLVTLDIGVNDVLDSGCIDIAMGIIDQACLMETFQAVGVGLSGILTTMEAAMAAKAPIIGMNYYNSFLALWLSPLQPQGMLLAQASAELLGLFNIQVLGAVYEGFHVPVADVASAYMINAFEPLVPFPPPFGMVPLNVATLCALTFMCPVPPAVPNIHANVDGYGVIALAFLEQVELLGLVTLPE